MLKHNGLLLLIVAAISINKFTRGEDVSCTTTDDCFKPNEQYECVNDVCTCTGTMTYVAELDQTMCIATVKLNDPCACDEQCQLDDENSFCNDAVGVCMCTGGFISTAGSNCSETSSPAYVMSYKFTEEEFNSSHTGILWCVLDVTHYTYINYTWFYHNGQPEENYTFTEPQICIDQDDDNGIYSIGLKLVEYYSGYYRCQFNIDEQVQDASCTEHDIRLVDNSTTGLSINQQCTSQTQCMAINSLCDTFANGVNCTCNCHGEYSVAYTNEPNTTACLQPVPFHGACSTDSQCAVKVSGAVCKYSKCQCPGSKTLSSDGKICEDSDNTLNGGAIAGIVIASLVGVVIIACVIYYVVKM